MESIDIVIPVHKYDASVKSLLTRCLESVKDMARYSSESGVKTNVFIVGPEELPSDEIMGLIEWKGEFNNFAMVSNTSGNLDFCSQVNFAVNESCKSDYFIIVEYDDIVTPKWVKTSLPYIEKRKKTSVFLPLIEIYDIESPKKPMSYINEIGWSSSFAENELGSLNLDALKTYCNFNITGGIIKRNEFIKAGGLKPSIKLSFGYEFLLRMANLYAEVFIIPKVGYYHFVNRTDSLTSDYHKTMSQEEGAWWIKLATQEYHFKKDRNKTYNPDEE